MPPAATSNGAILEAAKGVEIPVLVGARPDDHSHRLQKSSPTWPELVRRSCRRAPISTAPTAPISTPSKTPRMRRGSLPDGGV